MTTISPSLPSITSNVAVSLPKQSTRKKKTRLLRIQCRVDEKSTSTDKAGAGLSWVSPDWLTSFMKMRTGPDESGIPMANAKLDDVKDLLGGALFLPLFKWMKESGPVYRLAAGPRNFVVISDPEAAKHVLRNYGKYGKGLVSEVSQFLFGSGFAIAEGELWMVRRKAVLPSIHRKYLSVMVDRVFCKCAERLVEKLNRDTEMAVEVNMEEKFSQLTLDVIGLSLFNYNFDSLTSDSPLINAVYTALKEAESRSTDILPYWQVSSVQLRDDLLSMLVAGHETTGSVLTWTIYLLSQNPTSLKKAQEEVDRVLQGRNPQVSDMKELKYLTRCINESMRLYPHPPVLIRRAQEADILPGGYKVDVGQDIMISVYNIHHSPMVWDMADEFIPERFDLNGPVPNETNTDFRFIPFSGGPRKCVGDQFALLESLVALSILLQNFNFELVPNQTIGMTTGATIHTTTGLYMSVTKRQNRVLELTII
ncbi:carotene epsilon-monooxygenase, chloroplastic isoform X2 [Cryptomeria japonica]|uniref:carotene epsilon-monooxygenase, chloroplastic isoform X2 n=1 Tax=Cryptomeria japonica TaxID=3369 RepID=UPI0027DA8738|nr:carotene epsilon-monooxygenase, chloroplastic isoform X2 [Cryptomeria japonica]